MSSLWYDHIDYLFPRHLYTFIVMQICASLSAPSHY